jgi:septum site-determining protein MinD
MENGIKSNSRDSPEITKHWDANNGRMTLLIKNGQNSIHGMTILDSYPADITGIICFAKISGIAPVATASNGRITWTIANLKPFEVKELTYTSLTKETLNDPYAKKRPNSMDARLMESMAGIKPSVEHDNATEFLSEDTMENTAPIKNVEIAPAVARIENKDRKGTVISIGAGKGGTGKTTVSINLGVALSELGYSTIIMDADASMSNLGAYIGIDEHGLKATLHDVLAGEAEPEKAIYRAFNDKLRIVPSGMSIEGFLKMDRDLLNDVIEYFSNDADFIVIDTPAGYNKEVALSLLASDHLLLVLNPDEGSMIDGIKVQEMAKILGANVMGIILNRHDMKSPQYTRDQVEEYFGTPVIAMIPEEPGMRRKDRLPAVIGSPGSRASIEIYNVARSLTGNRIEAGKKSFVTKLMEALSRA